MDDIEKKPGKTGEILGNFGSYILHLHKDITNESWKLETSMRIEWGQNLFEAERGVEKKEKKGDCERSDDQMLHSTFVTSSLQPN